MNGAKELTVNADLIHEITMEQAWYYRIFPEALLVDTLCLYCEQGADVAALTDELEVLLGKNIVLQTLDPEVMARLLMLVCCASLM